MPPPAGSTFIGVSRFVERHFRLLAAMVLALAAFNLTFQLAAQAVTEWDEALYGLSAAEMLRTGDWVTTRLVGDIDYFNIKPPLNTWMVAAAFDAFGIGAVSLRLAAVLSAWTTVALLVWWVRRTFDPATALLSGLVLATSFGFLFVHSGRTGNPDAPAALIVLLVVVVLHLSIARPWVRLWLGPLLAAAFLLRGFGMLLPAAVVVAFEASQEHSPRDRARPLAVAMLLFAAIVTPWLYLRWSFDGFAFLGRLWTGEVARVTSAVETHTGSPIFYLDVLQKYHYEWLIAALAALVVLRPSPGGWRWAVGAVGAAPPHVRLLLCWAGATLLIPTLMQTKTTWYLNPFYPAFAVLVALLLRRAASRAAVLPRVAPAVALFAVASLAFVATEGRLVWEANRRVQRDPVHRLLDSARDTISGRVVFARQWTYADLFVLRELVGAHAQIAASADEFLLVSGEADYFVAEAGLPHASLRAVASVDDLVLYKRK